MLMPLVANAVADAGQLPFASGTNWWQTVGGLAIVFGLLMLFLKVLKKFNRANGAGDTSMITVWHLGPKREIQVLRLGEMVHYIYRHDGSMVVLKEESHTAFVARHGSDAPDSPKGFNLKELFSGKLPSLGSRSTA